MLRPLLLAVQFLTRLPVPSLRAITPREVGRSLLFYPLVGLLIGALLFGLDQLLRDAPPLLRAALIVAVWVALTGALHLDGLADMADAWVGGHGDRERTLTLMKDPAAGPMGVTALLLVVLLKFAALEPLAGYGSPLLLIIPLLGRTQLLLLFLTTPYVRRGGLGEALANGLPRPLGWAVVVMVVAALLLLGYGLLPLVALATLLLFRWALMRRLQGTTGDTAGALLEVSEAALLVAAALSGR